MGIFRFFLMKNDENKFSNFLYFLSIGRANIDFFIGLNFAILAITSIALIAIFDKAISPFNELKIVVLFFYDSVNTIFHIYTAKVFIIYNFLNQWLVTVLPGDVFSILAGFIFGQQKNITQNLYHDLKITGLMHLVVASGSNVSMMIGASDWGFRRFLTNKKLQYLVTLIIIWTYCFLLEGNVPIFRATLMGSLFLGSKLFHRQYKSFWFLFITFALLLAGNLSLILNLSFQLSILSSLGIIMIVPILNSNQFNLISFLETNGGPIFFSTQNNQLLKIFRDSFFTTLAAQLFSLPIILLTFHELSIISIFANTLLVGFVPLICAIGATLIISRFSSNFFSFPLIFATVILVRFFLLLINLMSNLSPDFWEIAFGKTSFVAWFLFILLLLITKYVKSLGDLKKYVEFE